MNPMELFKLIIKEGRTFNDGDGNHFLERTPERIQLFQRGLCHVRQQSAVVQRRKNYVMLIKTIFNFISELYNTLSHNIYVSLKNITKLTLMMINFYITFSQKTKNQSLIITECYIEKNLENVLSVLTCNTKINCG